MSEQIQTWTGWHFVKDDQKEQYGRHRKIVVGKTLKVAPPLQLCSHGLHASRRAIDALKYAPGPIVCRVTLSGEILEDTDKACATERTVLAMADATRTLHEFAVWCAREALSMERDRGREPDVRLWNALVVKERWLAGEATDQELDAAWDAAWAAARTATSAAAWAAAWDAAWAAARAAAWDAAWAAARAAAWAAANATANATASAAQNVELRRRLNELLEVGP